MDLPYFEGITANDLVALVDLMEPHQYAPDEVIVREGDEGPSPLYIATAGQVEITKLAPDGTERRLAELDSPTIFGEIELFCQIPNVATTRALSPVAAFSLSRPAFDAQFDAGHPAITRFTLNVARVACHRLAIADGMLARMLGGEDLVQLRRLAFASMAKSDDDRLSRTTGFFKRPRR
ncbi:MAG: cyclic nucleotide-binding domain-containing protein [Myxococcota bacterium]